MRKTKKRASGEGTIRQLPSGRWVWVRMTGRDKYGKPIYERITADTQRDLLKAIEQHKQEKSVYPLPEKVLFSVFAAQWFDRHKGFIALSTQDSYRYTLKLLTDYWGDKPLAAIVASDITDMLRYFRTEKAYSESYLKKFRTMMYQIMDAAEADNLVSKNPVRFVKHRSSDEVSPEKKIFSPTEIKHFLDAPQSKLRDFAILALATGMRSQEILALRGSDISCNGTAISIQRAVKMSENIPFIDKPKSKSSIRLIPVPSSVQHIAARYISYGNLLIWQSPVKEEGSPIHPSTYRMSFKRFCERIDVKVLTPHCCRHTYVTELYLHEVPEVTIKRLVGHSQHDVTEGYSHISQTHLAAAADRLNDLFVNIAS